MKRAVNIVAPILIAAGLVGLFWFLVDGKQIPVLQPSGEIAYTEKNLLIFTTALSLVVVLPVFTLLGYFAIKYRAGNERAKYMPEWSENRTLEWLWWGIPILIIGILGIVIVQSSHGLDPRKQLSGGKPLEVQVVAMRWKWLFIYPEQQVATLNHVQIPLDRPVRFSMVADAPMSAFWIPALGSQVYAMSGMQSQVNLKATELGKYNGYTTNINGEGYAKMTFTANVIAESEFTTWAEGAKHSKDAMNQKQYDELAKPGSLTEDRTYRLANAKLFESVLDQYGQMHGNHDEGGES